MGTIKTYYYTIAVASMPITHMWQKQNGYYQGTKWRSYRLTWKDSNTPAIVEIIITNQQAGEKFIFKSHKKLK